MKIIDFGKNTYQYEIDFKFDCISPETVRRIVNDLHISKKQFSNVSKDAATNQTILMQGLGTPEAPFYQLRISPDKIIFWAGWSVSYEKWQLWRMSLFTDLHVLMQEISTKMVLACVSQCAFLVPADKIKRGDQIPELAPVRAFYARGVPEELLERYNAHLAFSDENGKEILSFLVGGGQTQDESNITFNLRWDTFDNRISLEQNVLVHAARSDKLLELFNSGLLSLFVKT